MIDRDATSSVARRLGRADLLFVALLLLHVMVAVAVLANHPVLAESDDVARFVQIAIARGTPYRSFPVEYAPLETFLIRSSIGHGVSEALIRVAMISVLCDAGVSIVLRWRWGAREAITYLALALPLQVFIPFRLDLVPVLLVVVALALPRRRWLLVGSLVAAAVLFKLWPLVLVPVLVLREQTKAAIVALAASVAGLALWLALGGWRAIDYVASFQHSHGWGVGSTIGAMLAVSGSASIFERGTLRVGTAPGWAPSLLLLVGIVLLVLVWRKARDGTNRPEGFPALASVATVIAVSRVSSAQYVAWLLPFAAVALAERRRAVLLLTVSIASVSAALLFLELWGIAGDERTVAWLSLSRSLAIAAVPFLWLLEVGADRVWETATSTAPE